MVQTVWRKTLNGNNTTLRVFVGWDSREDIAYQACKQSLLTAAKYPNNLEIIEIHPSPWPGLDSKSADALCVMRLDQLIIGPKDLSTIVR